MQERINRSESKQYKVVFPNTLNNHNNLFGGIAMQWMDELAFITATRFTRMKMVTVSTGKIHFRNAIKSGTIAEITAKVIKVGNVKIDIQVEINAEEMYTDKKILAVNAVFTFAAVNQDNKAIRLNLEESLVI